MQFRAWHRSTIAHRLTSKVQLARYTTGELERLAEAHLRDVRQLGELGIAQTQKGLLKLTYDRASRTYTLRQFDGSGVVLATGRKTVIKAQLVQLYTIG